MNKFLILTLIVALACPAAQAAKIKSFTGQPVVFKAGDVNQQKVRIGMQVSDNDHIKCDATSRAEIILDGGHRVKIWPKSEFALEKATGKETSIKLIAGRVRSWVKKLHAGDKFEVRTPVAVCSVRGTDFSVGLDEQNRMKVEVYEGVVAAREEMSGKEVGVNAGEFSYINQNQPPEEPRPLPEGSQMPFDESVKPEANQYKDEATREIFQEISRENILAQAAEEIKTAEYQNGKSAIDVSGHRVRMEEYIVRGGPRVPTMTDSQFKYVVLNTRDSVPADAANPGNGHFNFGKILFTFNQTLPTDLTQATRTMFRAEGSLAPDWYLTDIASIMSNTADQVNESASGGKMYPDNPVAPRSWTHGFAQYAFYAGTGGNVKKWWEYIDVNQNGQLDANEITYYNITTGGAYNFSTDFKLDANTNKYYFLKDPAAADVAGNRTYFNEFTMPDGNTTFHFFQKNNYSNNQWIATDDYLLNDNGDVYSLANLQNMTSTQLNNEAYRSNFERVYTSSVFQGRKIDLVFSAKLLIDAGILSLRTPPKSQ